MGSDVTVLDEFGTGLYGLHELKRNVPDVFRQLEISKKDAGSEVKNMSERVWDQAGISQSEYAKLPWPKQRALLRRYRGFKIHESCSNCGQTWEESNLSRAPEAYRNHPFGLLIFAYQQSQYEGPDPSLQDEINNEMDERSENNRFREWDEI